MESYTITGMAHGTPLGIADNDERYGAEGAFLIEAGISSSYHIANFFGLTGARQPRPAKPADDAKARREAVPIARATVSLQWPDLATTLWPRRTAGSPASRAARTERRGIDVGDVITRALTAAGLMK